MLVERVKAMNGNFSKKRLTFSGLILLLMIFSILLSGCTDLKSIGNFANLSIDLTIFTSLTNDFSKSIERQKRYEDKSHYETLDAILKERQAIQPGILAIHKAVAGYMSVIGQLASDQTTAYDTSLDQVTETLATIINREGTPFFDSKQINSIEALTKLLANGVAENYRQNRLAHMIGASNRDFQILIQALMQFCQLYIDSLKTERSAIFNYYESVIKNAEANPPQQACLELLRDSYEGKLDNIDQKITDAQTYVTLLSKIASGHQKLYDNRNMITSKQLQSDILVRGQEIANLYKQIKALR